MQQHTELIELIANIHGASPSEADFASLQELLWEFSQGFDKSRLSHPFTTTIAKNKPIIEEAMHKYIESRKKKEEERKVALMFEALTAEYMTRFYDIHFKAQCNQLDLERQEKINKLNNGKDKLLLEQKEIEISEKKTKRALEIVQCMRPITTLFKKKSNL